ncbi:hypothetical protein V6N13_064285 [Hibiscus sabdariffa]
MHLAKAADRDTPIIDNVLAGDIMISQALVASVSVSIDSEQIDTEEQTDVSSATTNEVEADNLEASVEDDIYFPTLHA